MDALEFFELCFLSVAKSKATVRLACSGEPAPCHNHNGKTFCLGSSYSKIFQWTCSDTNDDMLIVFIDKYPKQV